MKKTTAILFLVFSTSTVFADEVNLGVGYNFILGSHYLTVGYQKAGWGVESSVMSMGDEEPNTKPGPLYSLSVLAYAPTWPVFVKSSYVFGGGKNGYNIGIGFDFKLSNKWSVRVQDTYYKMQEDFDEPAEGETLFSVGLKYTF